MVLRDIPVSPRARASARSCATVQLSSGLTAVRRRREELVATEGSSWPLVSVSVGRVCLLQALVGLLEVLDLRLELGVGLLEPSGLDLRALRCAFGLMELRAQLLDRGLELLLGGSRRLLPGHVDAFVGGVEGTIMPFPCSGALRSLPPQSDGRGSRDIKVVVTSFGASRGNTEVRGHSDPSAGRPVQLDLGRGLGGLAAAESSIPARRCGSAGRPSSRPSFRRCRRATDS